MSDLMNRFKFECPICGKTFYVQNPSEYVYKRFIKYKRKKKPERIVFCSYKCMRKHEKEHPTKYYNDVVR